MEIIMKIKTVPKDYIINAATEGRRAVSNFLLHGLLIKNDSKEQLQLKEITFELYSADTFIKQVTYQRKALEYAIKDFAEKRGWLGTGYGAQLFLGEEDFFHPASFTKSITLEPDQEIGIFNEYFIVVDDLKIDGMNIKVTYTQKGKEYNKECHLPLIEYKNKNDYIFPLKGSISTCGTYNALVEHRQHYSMEFAIDMAQLNDEQKLSFKEDMSNEDYTVYRKEVLAIAEGEVVTCYNDYFMVSSWVWEEREPYIKKYGFLPAQCGNHVVLKHAEGEYSFYGHLDTGSLTVKTGDKVAQGQIIGKVGHNGLSNCPHLHFQLMDGPDFLTARGLPCSFTNIRDVAGNRITLIQEDNIIVHAE